MNRDGDEDKDYYSAQEDLSVMYIVAKRIVTETKTTRKIV